MPEHLCEAVREAGFPRQMVRTGIHPDEMIANAQAARQGTAGELIEGHASRAVDGSEDGRAEPLGERE